jgi:hypothetical protein
MTNSLRIDNYYYYFCRFSNPVSYCDVLTWGNASCLTQCHPGFVSDLCHFLSRPVAAR